MSEVAGRMSVQQGAKLLENPSGGRGILLGGVPGTAPAHVTILGAGVVGTEAAKMAAGLGAHVHVLDTNIARLRSLSEILPANVTLLASDEERILSELRIADLVIGAVLIKGALAPRLVRRQDLKLMQPGSVIVDVAVDQGGCFETTRPTTHEAPSYVEEGIIHYCVANIPGAVSRTSTFALCNATLPYIRLLAKLGLAELCQNQPSFRSALNIAEGQVYDRGVAEAFNLPLVG
jgi:alanine dehydrogenase